MGPQSPARGGSPRESRRPGSSLRASLFSLALRAGASCPGNIQVTPICAAPGHPPRPPLGRSHHIPSQPWGSGSTAQCGGAGLTWHRVEHWSHGRKFCVPGYWTDGPAAVKPHLASFPSSPAGFLPSPSSWQGGSSASSGQVSAHFSDHPAPPVFPDSGSVSFSFQHVMFCHYCLFLLSCFSFSL